MMSCSASKKKYNDVMRQCRKKYKKSTKKYNVIWYYPNPNPNPNHCPTNDSHGSHQTEYVPPRKKAPEKSVANGAALRYANLTTSE